MPSRPPTGIGLGLGCEADTGTVSQSGLGLLWEKVQAFFNALTLPLQNL